MLAAGLLILKWIGMILLGILGLAVTLILLVLFVPVRYRARGSYYEELRGKASVSWLLHILSLDVAYKESDGELDVAIRIFGIRMKSRAGKDDTDFAEKPVKQKRQSAEAATEEEPIEDITTHEQAVTNEAGKSDDGSSQRPQTDKGPVKAKKRRKFSFPFRRICDKLKEVREQRDRVLEFLRKEENKASFRLVWKQFKALLKHILPTRAKGKVRFGFDDPYTTGQVLMYISPFYGLYAKTLTVIPVFEDAVIEGELSVRGRVRIGTVLFRIGLLALDKNVRKLWRQLKND